jgi:hypothetical protein
MVGVHGEVWQPAPVRSAVLILLLSVGSACQAPISWVVPRVVLDELSRDTRAPFDGEAFADQVRARYGSELEPAAQLEQNWTRLDLSGPPVERSALGSSTHPALAGLADGDLILAKNGHAQGLATTLGLAAPTWFDHSGFLVLDPEGAAVLESWPEARLLAKTPNFVSRFHGTTRRTPLPEFLARYEYVAFVRPLGDSSIWLETARRLVEQRIPFDPYHDPARPELSCAEFLSEALGSAGVGIPAPAPVSLQPSTMRVREALGFEVDAFLTPDAFARLPGSRQVGALGRHRSLAEVGALRAMWFEIHRRSQEPGAGMGDWLVVDRWRLFGWHPRTQALLRWAITLARIGAPGTPEQRARELVDLALGEPRPLD